MKCYKRSDDDGNELAMPDFVAKSPWLSDDPKYNRPWVLQNVCCLALADSVAPEYGPQSAASLVQKELALKHTASDTVVDFIHSIAKDNGFETSHLRTAEQLWVIGMTPKHVEHMFGTNFRNYIKGEAVRDIFEEVLGNSIFTTDGAEWKAHRMMASHLFTAQQLRIRMRAVFERRARQLQGILRDSAGKAFDMQRLMYCYTFDSINEIAFGRAVDSLAGNAADRDFQEAFDNAQAISARRAILPPLFWKGKRMIRVGDEVVMLRSNAFINDYLEKVIAERTDRCGEGEGDGRDLISLFYENCERDSRQPTAKEVRDLIMAFFIAGRDTTASLLTWTFYLLCSHPDVLARLRADLAAHADDYMGWSTLRRFCRRPCVSTPRFRWSSKWRNVPTCSLAGPASPRARG